MWRGPTMRTGRLLAHLKGRPQQVLSNRCASSGDVNNERPKAVIFDMGGVLLPSPFPVFSEYEKAMNIPSGVIIQTIVQGGPTGPWARMERGEITAQEVGPLMSKECSKVAGQDVDVTGLMSSFTSYRVESKSTMIPEMYTAIQCIKAEGIKTAVLSNNWFTTPGVSHLPIDRSLFDLVVESCVVGMKKPDPRIYEHICQQLNIKPTEAVFLDDIGSNLIPAADMGIKTIHVPTNPTECIPELQKVMGFDIRGFAAGTIATPTRLEIPLDNLIKYLNSLGLNGNEPPVVRMFEHGQSNPTYYVKYANKDLVLRKKPPGKLLPSAHAVEREYRVMKALGEQGVPVPKMLGLCEDSSLLGTPFYVMEYVKGRVFKNALLPELSPNERQQVYKAMCEVLAKIHSVDIDKAGLGDYGKRGNFVKRNFTRWSKQYEASKVKEMEPMDNLMKWLDERMPTNERVTVVHGDFRLDNLIFHPDKLEVAAVLDWELSTIGDPITDLATNCMAYYMPSGISGNLPGLAGEDIASMGIMTVDQYNETYARLANIPAIPTWSFYVAFVCFRLAAILAGVYKRAISGQSSSSTGESAGLLAEGIASIGWDIASSSNIPPNSANTNSGSASKDNMPQNYTTGRDRKIPGALPLSVSALSPRAQDYYNRARAFIENEVAPNEVEIYSRSLDPQLKWTIHPKLEELKEKAKAAGLWNLYLPKESDPDGKFGAPGLTNVEYAYICEEIGRHPLAAECFNSSAPDTGNMEVLIRYGTPAIQEKWLKPLLAGKIRSCFGMTEPGVASSDATNIQSSIRRDGNEYVINGHKWWTSGAMDPRCKVCIFMGKTNPDGPRHQQQSMIIVPMDAPGVKIVRALTVFGYEDAPHGHAEVLFENVRVPAENLLLGEGRGFEIAQGRLGPGRIHHCMRLIGAAERALALMCDRVQNRVAFGKPLAAQNSIQQDIAKSRIEIDMCRLLVLKAAHLMDTVGNKVAAPEIAMIKVDAPSMALRVIDRAIQAHGGMGVCQDTPLAMLYANNRTLRLADGPDEVHMRAVARYEFREQNSSKL